MVAYREPRLEDAAAHAQRRVADCLEGSRLPERRRSRQPLPVGARPEHRRGPLEAAARRRRPRHAQAEHVVAVAGDRWDGCLGDDGHGGPEEFHLRRQGAVGTRHPEGLRRLRPQLGLRQLSAAPWRRAVRAGAARHEDRRPQLPAADREDDGQDGVEAGAADQGHCRSARRLYHAGAADRGQAHRDRRLRRRHRHGARSGDGQGTVAQRRPQPDQSPVPTHHCVARRQWLDRLHAKPREAPAGPQGRRVG